MMFVFKSKYTEHDFMQDTLQTSLETLFSEDKGKINKDWVLFVV